MTLRGRIEKLKTQLEETYGAGECPPCSGTTVVYVGDKLESLTRGRRILTPEEAQEFEAEEEDGRCPVWRP